MLTYFPSFSFICIIGVGGTNVTTSENWIPDNNAPRDSCEMTMKVKKCTKEQEEEWRREVYEGHKGGPTSKEAVEIMMNAKEKIMYSLNDLEIYLRVEK